jgi:hypothetical protein
VTNVIPLGCSLLLPVDVVNSVQTLKVQVNEALLKATDAVRRQEDERRLLLQQEQQKGREIAGAHAKLRGMLNRLEPAMAEPIWSAVKEGIMYGARFSTKIPTRGCHWFPRLLA